MEESKKKFLKIELDPLSLSSIQKKKKNKQTKEKKKRKEKYSRGRIVRSRKWLIFRCAMWAINQAPSVRRTTEKEREREREVE